MLRESFDERQRAIGESAHGWKDTNHIPHVEPVIGSETACFVGLLDTGLGFGQDDVLCLRTPAPKGHLPMPTRLIAACLMLASAGLAQAQMMSGPFMGDLGWKILRERLGLAAPSPAQLEDIAQIHNQYLASMKLLRTEHIDPFLNETKGMGSITATDPDEARRGIAKTEKIHRLVAEQESLLMDQIASVLGDTQQAPLERIREHRSRERLCHRPMDLIGGSPLPKTEPRFAIDWRSLSDSERAEIESILTPWEDRYTGQLKTLSTARSKALIEFSKTLAVLNAAQAEFGNTPPGPAEMSRLINLFRDAQRNAQELTEPTKIALQRHVVKGLRELAPLIPSSQRIKVIRLSSGNTGLNDQVTPMAGRTRRMDLPKDVHAEIGVILDVWYDDATLLLIDALEANWRDIREQQNAVTEVDEEGNMTFDIPGSENSIAAMKAWNSRSAEAMDAISALVPEELADALQQDGDTEEEQSVVTTSTAVVISSGGGSDSDETVVVATETSPGGEYGGLFDDLNVLPALRQSLIDGLARDLALTEADRRTLDELFETHDTARAELEAMRLAKKNAKKDEFSDRIADMTEADQMAFAIEMMTPISQEGLSELDDAFFEGVATIGNSEAIEPWRLSRVREMLVGVGGISRTLRLIGVPDNRANVDLLNLVSNASLNDREYAAAREALSRWHGPATALMEDIQSKTVKLDEAMRAMMSQEQSGGSMSIDLTAAMEIDQMQTAVATQRAELSALAQETVQTIESVLSNTDDFHRMWLLEAHPEVASQDPFIDMYDRVLKIDSLTDDQRATIAAMRIEHNDAWWTATEEAIATIETPQNTPANQQEAFFAAQRVRQNIQQQAFARRESALKRLEQVRSLLTEEQLAVAAGLPDPAAPRTAGVPF